MDEEDATKIRSPNCIRSSDLIEKRWDRLVTRVEEFYGIKKMSL